MTSQRAVSVEMVDTDPWAHCRQSSGVPLGSDWRPVSRDLPAAQFSPLAALSHTSNASL